MEFTNFFLKEECRPRWAMEQFVLLLSPLAPHVAEELWQALGHATTLAYEPWPQWDEAKLREDSVEIPVQINGKLRGRIVVAAGTHPGRIEPGRPGRRADRGVAGRQGDRQGDRGAGPDGEFRGEVSDLQTPATRASKSATQTAGAVSKPMPVSLPRATLAFIASLLPGKETMNTRS